MHAGKPYGLHVVGGALTPEDESFIDVSAKRLSNLKDISGVESLRLVYNLPDGGSFIVQDMGGNFRVVAYKPLFEVETYTTDGLAKNEVPLLFSGVPSQWTIIPNEQGLPIKISEQTRKRVFNYSGKLAPKEPVLHRFVCEYGARFQEFLPQQQIGNVTYTQYGKQRPTWYSGAMAEVMQIVGGYGVQELDTLPDTELERARFIIPPRYQSRIDAELKDLRLPAYTGLAHKKGQYQYDYKYINTNLVSFDEVGNPWLLKVDLSGVWAMPLPIVPASRTVAFREYIEEVGDQELLAILNKYGAMPSGETFPATTVDFEAWRRAGVIIKLCSTKEFYKHMAYSSAMGWSINDSGTEAVNTCYDIDGITGFFTSFTYKMRIRLGSATNLGWSPRRKSQDFESGRFDVNKINAYLSKLYADITEDTPTNHAIKYKISTVSVDDIAARAEQPYVGTELYYWDNLEVSPIAEHSCAMVKINEGVFYAGRNIKIPEPIFDCCISLPVPPPNPASQLTNFDTIAIAYFIGDSLKTIKLFNDTTEYPASIADNFEDYMYVGKWERREQQGGGRIQGDIYTTDIDHRRVLAPTETVTNIEGRDLGYTEPAFQFDFYFWRTGDFWRDRHYTTKTNTVSITDGTILIGVAIPYYCRNMLLYAKSEGYGTKVTTEKLTAGKVRDPYQYRYWTDAQSLFLFGSLPVQKGSPRPIEGRPVWAEIQNYNPDASNSFADSGPWISALPTDISSMMYQYSNTIWGYQGIPPAPPVKTYSNQSTERNKSDKSLLCQVFDRVEAIGRGTHADDYYQLSVGGSDIVFYRDASKVVFGSTQYANISEKTETGNRKQWGESALVDNKTAHHFIGVINE